jgi:hypothetical protein
MHDGVVARAKHIFGNLNVVAGRLGEIEESELSTGSCPRLPDLIARAALEGKRRAVTDGICGLKKIRQGRERDLTPDEVFGIEAIVLEEGRPSILIHEGDFLPPPPEWGALYTHRTEIRRSIGCVGRVAVEGDPYRSWLGTGFLIGPRSIMTSRAVALGFSRREGGSWKFRTRMSSRLDFAEEPGTNRSMDHLVTEVLGIHEDHDLALLRVEAASSSGAPLPEPLVLASSEPRDLRGREVYQIGYPAWDSRGGNKTMRTIFMDVFDVKRLQPGEVTGLAVAEARLRHDCSALGDTCGAPVIDLESHRVLGLHAGGRLHSGGRAVPLWLLARDSMIREANVNFA